MVDMAGSRMKNFGFLTLNSVGPIESLAADLSAALNRHI